MDMPKSTEFKRASEFDLSPEDLAKKIDVALSRAGTVCDVNKLSVFVYLPDLSDSDKSLIQKEIDNYVFKKSYSDPKNCSLEKVQSFVNSLEEGNVKSALQLICEHLALIN